MTKQTTIEMARLECGSLIFIRKTEQKYNIKLYCNINLFLIPYMQF